MKIPKSITAVPAVVALLLNLIWISRADGQVPIAPPTVAPGTAAIPFAASPDAPFRRDLDSFNNFFICQYGNPRFNPGGPKASLQCGPASFAMALRYFGNYSALNKTPKEAIDYARVLMTGNTEDKSTNMNDVIRGARRLKMNATIARTMGDIDKYLAQGRVGVLSGGPAAAGTYAPRLNYHYGNGGHFVLIVKKLGPDAYMLADPEFPDGAHVVTRKEIVAYKYWYNPTSFLHGAIMIGPPRPA